MISRRGMLKALGLATGISVLTYTGSICDSGKHGLEEKMLEQRKGFDGLWDKVLDFNEKYNHFYEGKSSKDDVTKAWEDIIEYNRTNFPQLFENGEFDYWKYQDLCRENGKVYVKHVNFSDPTISTITLGDIVEKYKKKIHFKNEKLEYEVIIFEKESLNIDDTRNTKGIGAWWDERTKSVYINLTSLKEDAKLIYEVGSKTKQKQPTSFRLAMIKELYNGVISAINKENVLRLPLSPTEDYDYKTFEKKFVEIIIKSTINHEIMHHFFKYSINPDGFIKDEKETFLYQIAKDPEYNAWAFLITNNNPRYINFYKAFEKYKNMAGEGYTKERLMKIKPDERSKIAADILPIDIH